MNIVFKATAGILVSVVICLVLSKREKDLSILLTIATCCMVITACIAFINPIISFTKKLCDIGQLNSDTLSILLKAVGIGLLTEITYWICADAGYSSMGKAFQILSSVAIIWLSLPLFEKMLELIENILGAI